MLRYAVLCLTVALASSFDEHKPPKWALSYTMDVDAIFPLEGGHVPLSIWYDRRNGKSLTSYYGGTNKVYLFSNTDTSDFGSGNVIYPMSIDDELNKMTCMSWSNIGPTHQHPHNLLVDTSEFDYNGTEKINGVETTKWVFSAQNSYKEDVMKLMFVVWVVHDSSQADAQPKPFRYEEKVVFVNQSVTVWDMRLDYFNYEPKDIDPKAFEIDSSVHCEYAGGDTAAPYIPTVGLIGNSFISGDKLYLEHHFEKFKNTHGKEYESAVEHWQRMKIFERNWRLIEEHNRGGHGYTMALNHFADRTEEELMAMPGLRVPDSIPRGRPFPYSAREIEEMSEDLPEQWDWRLEGAVTGVKDQFICGSCWAFSAVGALEGAFFLHYKERVRLSEQALVDCAWGNGDGGIATGCYGGHPTFAFSYIKKYGLPRELDYGDYMGVNGFCHRDNVTSIAKVTDWVDVTRYDDDALRLAIFKHGPVSVAVCATSSFFFYSSGIFPEEECLLGKYFRINHVVVAVGFGVLHGEKYWILKNSWGYHWGNDGYMLMTTKGGGCGVTVIPSYVTFD